MRSAQVQGEIAEWTAKEPLEPMALGLRYTELEVIRRELRDGLARTREKVMAVLDNAQKAKLKTLEDAMKLQPVIAQAQCENLLAQARRFLRPLVRAGDFTFTRGVPVRRNGLRQLSPRHARRQLRPAVCARPRAALTRATHVPSSPGSRRR